MAMIYYMYATNIGITLLRTFTGILISPQRITIIDYVLYERKRSLRSISRDQYIAI